MNNGAKAQEQMGGLQLRDLVNLHSHAEQLREREVDDSFLHQQDNKEVNKMFQRPMGPPPPPPRRPQQQSRPSDSGEERKNSSEEQDEKKSSNSESSEEEEENSSGTRARDDVAESGEEKKGNNGFPPFFFQNDDEETSIEKAMQEEFPHNLEDQSEEYLATVPWNDDPKNKTSNDKIPSLQSNGIVKKLRGMIPFLGSGSKNNGKGQQGSSMLHRILRPKTSFFGRRKKREVRSQPKVCLFEFSERIV